VTSRASTMHVVEDAGCSVAPGLTSTRASDVGEVTSLLTLVLSPGYWASFRVTRSFPRAENQSHRIGSALSAVRYGPLPVLTFGP